MTNGTGKQSDECGNCKSSKDDVVKSFLDRCQEAGELRLRFLVLSEEFVSANEVLLIAEYTSICLCRKLFKHSLDEPEFLEELKPVFEGDGLSLLALAGPFPEKFSKLLILYLEDLSCLRILLLLLRLLRQRL